MRLSCHKGAFTRRKTRQKLQAIDSLNVKRILVIRHAALGDMILTRPFLKELGLHFPHAHIILSTSSNYQVGIPKDLVDEVHTCYTSQDRKGLLEQFRKLNEIEPVDLLFDLAATSRSSQISFLTKSKIKIGFPYKKNLFIYDINLLRSDFIFEAQLLLDFLCVLGLEVQYPLDFSFPQFKKEIAHKRIVYFMGASNHKKKYPMEYFLLLIKENSKLFPNYEHHILQGVGASEKYLGLYGSLKSQENIKLIELMHLDELALYLAESRLLVSNDTGVKNLGICTHTPSLVISVSEHPFRYLPRYEFQHHVIFNDPDKVILPNIIQKRISHILKENYESK